MAEEVEDPITELAAGALHVHEMYLAYLNAGFTEHQALELIKTFIIASCGGG